MSHDEDVIACGMALRATRRRRQRPPLGLAFRVFAAAFWAAIGLAFALGAFAYYCLWKMNQ